MNGFLSLSLFWAAAQLAVKHLSQIGIKVLHRESIGSSRGHEANCHYSRGKGMKFASGPLGEALGPVQQMAEKSPREGATMQVAQTTPLH